MSVLVTFESGTVIEFDAAPQVTHEAQADVTDWPVESGTQISDHATVKPKTLSVTGFVSVRPLRAIQPAAMPDKERAAWADASVLDALERRTPLKVSTSLRTYSQMLLTSYQAPQTLEDSGGIRMTLAFKEIKTVESQTVSVKKIRSGKRYTRAKKVDKGTVPAMTPGQRLIVNAGKVGAILLSLR